MDYSQPNPFEQALHIIKTVATYTDVLNDLKRIDTARKNLWMNETPLFLLYAQDTDKEMRAKYPGIQTVINIAISMSPPTFNTQNGSPATAERATLENLEKDGIAIITLAAVNEGIKSDIRTFIQEAVWVKNPHNNFTPFLT